MGVSATLALAFLLTPPASPVEELDLPSLIARAKKHARVRAETANIGAQEAQHTEAKGASYPKLSANAFLGPSPEINCVNAECTITEPREARVAFNGLFGGIQVRFAQPLYTFGKLAAVERAAAHAVTAARFRKTSVEADLTRRAVQAYYGLKVARELHHMLKDGRQQIEKAHKKVTQEVARGKSDLTIQDRMRLRVLRAEVETRLAEVERTLETARTGVQELAGGIVDIDRKPLEPRVFKLEKSAASYKERATRHRVELRAGRALVESARHLASLEKAAWWPDLLVAGGANLARAQGVDDAPSVFANDPFNVSSVQLGLALKWTLDPVSQWGRSEKRQAQAQQAEELLLAGESATRLEVAQAWAEARAAERRMAGAYDGQKAAKGWVASVLQGEAIGITAPKDLADAYVAYFTMRAKYLEAIYDWNRAVWELRYLIGEWTAGTPRP